MRRLECTVVHAYTYMHIHAYMHNVIHICTPIYIYKYLLCYNTSMT